MAKEPLLSQEDYLKTLEELIEHKNDPISITNNIISLLGGGALGVGAVAATGIGAGITGSVLGLIGITTFSLPALPALAAGAIVGMGAARFLSKSHRKSAILDMKKELLRQDLRKKILQYGQNIQQNSDKENKMNALDAIFTAFTQKKISEEDCNDLKNLVINNEITPLAALDTLKNLINDKNCNTTNTTNIVQ